jgi:hypothetical protein
VPWRLVFRVAMPPRRVPRRDRRRPAARRPQTGGHVQIRTLRITLATVVGLLATVPVAWAGQPKAAAASQPRPGGPLIRSNSTPYPSSKLIVGARWTSGRYDPPSNQSGDILPTVWSDDGSTYVLMDDGGVDVPVSGGLWRHSFARIIGKPPNLNFKHIGDPFSPAPHLGSDRRQSGQ